MKKIAILFLALTVAFTLGACCLRHEWTEATYTHAKTCIACGKHSADGKLSCFGIIHGVNKLRRQYLYHP